MTDKQRIEAYENKKGKIEIVMHEVKRKKRKKILKKSIKILLF